MSVPSAQFKPIYFDDVVAKAEKPLPYRFVFGVDPFGEPLYASIDDPMFPHMLLAGTTASGKSIFVHSMLAQLLLNDSPTDLRVLFLDAGLATQFPYAEVPHLWSPLVDSREAALDQLQSVLDEMETRVRLFTEMGADDLDCYMRILPGAEMPVILVVIDESARFTHDKEIKDSYLPKIMSLLRLGRKYGIHVLLGVQRPMADILGVGMKDSLGQRFILRLEAPEHSENVLDGDTAAVGLSGYGDGIFRRGDDVIRFQGLYLPEYEDKPSGHLTVPGAVAAIIARWDEEED